MSRLKELVYPNLYAEIMRNGEKQQDIGNLLGIAKTTVNHKLSGKYDWTISEIETLCNHFKKDYYELFKRKD